MADQQPQEIHPSRINAAKESFAQDQPITGDLQPGDFFDDPNYLETLPRNAKVLICAVQHAGDHPDRPGLCHIQSNMAFARYKESQNEDDLFMALALEAMSLRYVLAAHPGRGKSNHHMGDLYVRKWKTKKNDMHLDEAIRHYKLAIDWAQETNEVLCEWACGLAVVQLERYNKTKQESDKNEARESFDKAIQLAGELPVRARHISNNGYFLFSVASRNDAEREAQLSESIAVHHEAVEFCDTHPDLSSMSQIPYGMIYRNTGLAYKARFAITKGDDDGRRASSLLEKALTYEKPGGENWEKFTNELANIQHLVGQVSGDGDPEEKARDVWRKAIEANPISITPRVNLARSYREKAEKSVDQNLAQDLLQKALCLVDDAVKALTPGHPNAGLTYSCSASVHLTLYELRGDLANLDRAIEFAQKATHDEKDVNVWDYYRLLAQLFIDRYERLGRDKDLEDGNNAALMGLSKCALDDVTTRPQCLWILAKACRANYNKTRYLGLLQQVCVAFSQISQVMPKNSTSRSLVLNDLGNAYTQLFSYEALPSQLEKAIEAYQEALSEMKFLYGGDQHPDIFMVNAALGNVMTQRFLHWKSDADIESAINYYRRSLSQIDKYNPRYPIRVGNLCHALQLRFDVKKDSRDLKDLEEAQNILHLTLDGPAPMSDEIKTGLSMHLGNVYQYTYRITEERSDLENAIEQYSKALAVEGASSTSSYGITLLNKAVAIKELAVITGNLSDFEASGEAFEDVQKLLSEGDPNQWKAMLNHGNLLYIKYERNLGPESKGYACLALEKYESLARMSNVPASVRISVAAIAVRIASDEPQDPVKARDNILISLTLLPEAIPMHETRLRQLDFVREYQLIPGAVASLSLSAGDSPSTVLHRLEAGRAFIWDRIQGRPTRLDDLQIENPELAERFRTLQQRFFHKPHPAGRLDGIDLTSISLKDVNRMNSHHDADSYRQVLEEIRALPGFASFLKTSDTPADLQSYAADAPILFINVTAYRSDAIIITRDDVQHLPLPLSNMDEVKSYVLRFAIALHNLGSEEDQHKALPEYEAVMKWHWEVAAKPILSIINWEKYKTRPLETPRIIWVSAGWISILPIHAAGNFETPSTESNEPTCVHDMVVSSYTNSLKALDFIRHIATQRRNGAHPSHTRQALVAAMATTPGFGSAGDLNVEPEVATIREALSPSIDVKVLMQPDSSAVKKSISPETAIVHFACHARADDKDPSRSAIMLQDNQTKPPPFSVRTLLNLDLKSCELVYLSACESGVSKVLSLRDEGIHIAGGFHIAGVSHVISTLWKVSDTVSADLAGLFYVNLKNSGSGALELGRAPYALHLAVREMRTRGIHPILWAAFIHSGP
ncbi:hypothetical protein N7540_012998 [Penicillium herquei]|nr:hypothetical protein N7540_012998 [Penicillium herquei]